MARWAEIEKLRKNAGAFRALAAALLRLGDDLSDWEEAFLENVARRSDVAEFSTRQAEKLLEIRDNSAVIDKWRGFSIRALLSGCHEARCDLGEDDERWIVTLRGANAASIKRRQLGRLLRISRSLHLIDEMETAP